MATVDTPARNGEMWRSVILSRVLPLPPPLVFLPFFLILYRLGSSFLLTYPPFRVLKYFIYRSSIALACVQHRIPLIRRASNFHTPHLSLISDGIFGKKSFSFDLYVHVFINWYNYLWNNYNYIWITWNLVRLRRFIKSLRSL